LLRHRRGLLLDRNFEVARISATNNFIVLNKIAAAAMSRLFFSANLSWRNLPDIVLLCKEKIL
jgi:hypothetical protein